MLKKIIKKIKNSSILNFILKHCIYFYLRLLFITYRLRKTKEKANLNKGVFYFWHQNIIAVMFFLFKNKYIGHYIISPSNDGKIIGFVAKKLGLKVIYGSAYKNALKSIRTSLDILDLNKRIVIIGDGSRGPAFELQRGVIYLAAKSELSLVFIDCKSEWTITFNKSWDKFKIPLPFSKIRVKVHTPVLPSIDAYKNF